MPTQILESDATWREMQWLLQLRDKAKIDFFQPVQAKRESTVEHLKEMQEKKGVCEASAEEALTATIVGQSRQALDTYEVTKLGEFPKIKKYRPKKKAA